MHDPDVQAKLAALRQRARSVDPTELDRRRRARQTRARTEMLRAWRMDAVLSSLDRKRRAPRPRCSTALGRFDLLQQLRCEAERAPCPRAGRDVGEGVWISPGAGL